MTEDYYKQYEPIFGVWHITRLIGEGSLSKVFEMEREDFGQVHKAALKAITIPASQREVRQMLEQGEDEAAVRSHFQDAVQELVGKLYLASNFRGHPNIVSYEKYQVLGHQVGMAWDILIEMELLTPLDDYIRQKKFLPRQEIIKLGIDLCKALELCQKCRILHRDIKPGNIFVSERGDFKLGDFGTAQYLDRASDSTVRGTYTYMAPEVYKGEGCGFPSDLYSLGLVLYQLLNDNRLPFMPPAPAPFSFADREQALQKRLSGAPLPMPSHADRRLWEIVEKACACDPQNRYADAAQLRQALEQVDNSSPVAPADERPGHGWPREWRTDEISSFVLRQGETEFTCDGDQVTMKLALERNGQPFAPIVVRLTAPQREALREQLACIRQEGWGMTREQLELLGAHDYGWDKCFRCALPGGRQFQYLSNDDVPRGFTALYEFLYRLAFPRGQCAENAHAFVPAVMRSRRRCLPEDYLYCENCGLAIPFLAAEFYSGSKILNVAYTWPASWRAEDILSFSVGFGDCPIRCFTWEGNLLTAVNRIDVSADGGRDFPPGYFDPVSIRLSDEQKEQLRRCLEVIPQERWNSDFTALRYELRCPTGYTRHTYFSCTMKSGEKFDYLPGEEVAPGFTRLCRCLEAMLPWKETKSGPGFWNRLFGQKS